MRRQGWLWPVATYVFLFMNLPQHSALTHLLACLQSSPNRQPLSSTCRQADGPAARPQLPPRIRSSRGVPGGCAACRPLPERSAGGEGGAGRACRGWPGRAEVVQVLGPAAADRCCPHTPRIWTSNRHVLTNRHNPSTRRRPPRRGGAWMRRARGVPGACWHMHPTWCPFASELSSSRQWWRRWDGGGGATG